MKSFTFTTLLVALIAFTSCTVEDSIVPLTDTNSDKAQYNDVHTSAPKESVYGYSDITIIRDETVSTGYYLVDLETNESFVPRNTEFFAQAEEGTIYRVRLDRSSLVAEYVDGLDSYNVTSVEEDPEKNNYEYDDVNYVVHELEEGTQDEAEMDKPFHNQRKNLEGAAENENNENGFYTPGKDITGATEKGNAGNAHYTPGKDITGSVDKGQSASN